MLLLIEELLKNSAYATLLTRGEDPKGLQHFPVVITVGSDNQQAQRRSFEARRVGAFAWFEKRVSRFAYGYECGSYMMLYDRLNMVKTILFKKELMVLEVSTVVVGSLFDVMIGAGSRWSLRSVIATWTISVDVSVALDERFHGALPGLG